MPVNNKSELEFKETEVGLIPIDWEVRIISEITQISGGGTPSTQVPEYWGDEILWLTPSDVTSHHGLYLEYTSRSITEQGLNNSSAKLMPPGSVLMTSRATIGEVVICSVPMATNQGFINLIVNPELLLNEYLAYWISWRKDYLRKLGSGTTFLEIAKGVFKTISIPLPPIAEQRRIAIMLNTFQDGIAVQDDILKELHEFKHSTLERLFTYGTGSISAETQMTEVGKIPVHWGVVKLGTMVDTQYGLSVKAGITGQYPMLRMNNLGYGKLDISDLKYADLSDRIFSNFKLNAGDILFNRTNSYELVGKTALFDIEGDYTFASYIVRVVVQRQQLSPRFINHYLNFPGTQYRLKMLASRGASQSNISATKLKNFEIVLPPLEEQDKIAQMLDSIDEKIAAEEDRKSALEELFRTMLHQLMTGQIRLLSDEGLPL